MRSRGTPRTTRGRPSPQRQTQPASAGRRRPAMRGKHPLITNTVKRHKNTVKRFFGLSAPKSCKILERICRFSRSTNAVKPVYPNHPKHALIPHLHPPEMQMMFLYHPTPRTSRTSSRATPPARRPSPVLLVPRLPIHQPRSNTFQTPAFPKSRSRARFPPAMPKIRRAPRPAIHRRANHTRPRRPSCQPPYT